MTILASLEPEFRLRKRNEKDKMLKDLKKTEKMEGQCLG
jgi:hypothetical protein